MNDSYFNKLLPYEKRAGIRLYSWILLIVLFKNKEFSPIFNAKAYSGFTDNMRCISISLSKGKGILKADLLSTAVVRGLEVFPPSRKRVLRDVI